MAASSLTEAVSVVEQHFESSPALSGSAEAAPGSAAVPAVWPDVVAVLSGSSTLVAQLSAGAEADLLITADAATMQRAHSEGVVRGAPVVIAVNSLVLATAPGNPGAVRSLDDLSRPGLLIGLCAKDVPCGALAGRSLEAAGVTASPDTLEPNVRALAVKIALGELDAGLVYATDAAALELQTVQAPELNEHVNRYLMASVESLPSPPGQAVMDAFEPGGIGAQALRQLGFGAP